jgi:DNA invertase Pin-like site-specific DNA recombinase
VSYYRVSTERQGKSGLGLDAQRAAVLAFINGGSEIVAEFVEVESGKRQDRPELAKALAACQLHRATLVIAKLDRLARNVAFVSGLMEAGVDFVAVDMPMANRLTVHILAAVAEHEGRAISERTKAALQAAKERGIKLGGFRGHKVDGALGNAAKSARSAEHARLLADTLAPLVDAGLSAKAMAEHLNAAGVPARRGGQWHPEAVRRVVGKLNEIRILDNSVLLNRDGGLLHTR